MTNFFHKLITLWFMFLLWSAFPKFMAAASAGWGREKQGTANIRNLGEHLWGQDIGAPPRLDNCRPTDMELPKLVELQYDKIEYNRKIYLRTVMFMSVISCRVL